MGSKGKGPRRPPPSADQMAARLDRAAGERMFFMGRVASPAAAGGNGGGEVDGDGDGGGGGGGGGAPGVLAPFVVTGLSGSVYTIHLSTEEAGPSAADAGGVGIVAKCNCRDYIFRRAACKHILFILLRVLNIPKDRLLAALSPPYTPLTHTEVTAAAAASRSASINPFYAPPKELADRLRAIAGDFSGGGVGSGTGAGAPPPAATPRVPEADDDCPICYEAFGVVSSAADPAVVYCRRGCGGGVHADCFRRWEANAAGAVTCVYCRALWGAPPAPVGGGGGAAAASGNVLDSSRGGRARLIDLGNYLPDGPPTRKGGKGKKKGGTAAAATVDAGATSGSGKGKGKGKGKAAARPAKDPPTVLEPASDADADVAVVASRPAPARASTRGGDKAVKAAAAAAAAAAASAPRATRSGMATRSRRAAPTYMELSGSEDDGGGGGDTAEPSDASAGYGDSSDGDASPPPPKRSRRSRG